MNAIRTLRKIIHPNFLPVAIYKEKYSTDEVSSYVLYGTSNDGEDYFSLPLEFSNESVDEPHFFVEEPLLYVFTSLIGENAILENFMFQKLYALWECMDELYHYSDFPKLEKRLNEESVVPNLLDIFISVAEYKNIADLLLSNFHSIEDAGSSNGVIRYRITLVNGNNVNIAYDYNDHIAYKDLMTYPRDSCGLEAGVIHAICQQAELLVRNYVYAYI